MRKSDGISVRSLGARLRELRVRAMLTQEEVAERMQMARNDVWRLELGKAAAPSVSKVSRYLQACAASWFELAGMLDEIEPVMASRSRRQAGSRPSGHIEDESDRQALKYQRRLRFFTGRKPVAPKQQTLMAQRLRNYRVTANSIEQAVAAMLRLEPIPPLSYARYYAVARHLLGLLWRRAKSKAGREELLRGRGRAGQDLFPALKERLPFWQKQGLDLDLAARIQEEVLTQFRRLLRNYPQLFVAR